MKVKHLAAVVAAGAVAVSAAPADAQTTTPPAPTLTGYSCSATGVRLGTLELGKVFAPTSDCGDASQSLIGLGTVGVASGSTSFTPGVPGQSPTVAASDASLANLDVNVVGLRIRSALVASSSRTICTKQVNDAGQTTAVLSHKGGGKVIALNINGRTYDSKSPDAPQVIDVLGLVRVWVNRTIQDKGGLVQRALQVDLLGKPILVVGEAATGLTPTSTACSSGGILIPNPQT